MGGKPAARLLDLTVHVPVVISGSPDTIISYMPAGRLNDLTAPCPVCKTPPPGKIVTSSKTVFVNGLGAARISDKVACGAGGSPPGGGSHPPAKGYKVRGEDSHEKMMKGEHEISEFDLVDSHQRDKLDGSRDDAATPVGIQPSNSGGAGRPSPGSRPAPGANGGSPYASSESPNPWGRSVHRGERKNAGEIKGGDIRPQAEESLTGRKSVGIGEHSAGAKFGKGDGGKTGPVKVEYDKEEKRVKVTINLDFSLELSIGKRSGQAGYGGAANMIAKGALTVIIGD